MLRSEQNFASCMAYSVRGATQEILSSQHWRDALKHERSVGQPRCRMSRLFARRLRARLDETPFASILTPTAVLVPVPSSRLKQPGSLWVPLELATALVEVGLGRTVEVLLERFVALPKSAWVDPNERPTSQQHYDSLRVLPQMYPPEEVVLVDDVITRGATMLGSASLLSDAFPKSQISCFAAMRAVSDANEFTAIFDPQFGKIRLLPNGRTARRP